MRLDKYLSDVGYSRKNAVELIKSGNIKVNDIIVKQKDFKIDEKTDIIFCNNNKIIYQKYTYIMIYKPNGVVSATEDVSQKTIIDLLPVDLRSKHLFPVGRLDKDTEGLLFLTNDGNFCHNVISPKKEINKVYEFELIESISEENVNKIQLGILLKDGFTTKPCKIDMYSLTFGRITITEGKYHQIRRMFGAVGNKVVFLKRISEAGLLLDKNLKSGEWRYLSEIEVAGIIKKHIDK